MAKAESVLNCFNQLPLGRPDETQPLDRLCPRRKRSLLEREKCSILGFCVVADSI